jgi:hypothetical protein
MRTYVPIVTENDLLDPVRLIEKKRLLADAICFVTASRVPGKGLAFDKLMSTISKFVQYPYPTKTDDYDEDWITLQSLAVTYVFGAAVAGHPAVARGSRSSDIPHLSIMRITEYAMNLGVDRSIERVQGFLRRIPTVSYFKLEDVPTLPSYKKYIFWLWLFTMSY